MEAVHVDFPIYTVQTVGDRHFVVAGGGGGARTGVENKIEIFELIRDGVGSAKGKSICRHSTGDTAVMNSSVTGSGLNIQLACGQGPNCCSYALKQKLITPRDTSADPAAAVQTRKRKSGLTQSANHKNAPKRVSYEVQMENFVQTDEDGGDTGFQKCVCFGPSGHLLVTGAASGSVSAWKFPSLSKSWSVKAGADDVDAVHIDPSASLVATVSRTQPISIWKLADGVKVTDLKWPPLSVKYQHKSCRFGNMRSDKERSFFSIEVPSVGRKPPPSYVTKWCVGTDGKHSAELQVKGTCEKWSTMDISKSGSHLGIGTLEGSVSIYDTQKLQRLYHVAGAHRSFVTGVSFFPESSYLQALLGKRESALLSISIDNQVKLHSMHRKHRRTYFFVCMTVMAIVGIFWHLVFIALSVRAM